MKLCTACQKEKPLFDFHKDKSRKDGLRNRCKECVSAYMAAHYTENTDHIKAKTYAWIAANRERHNQKCARWVKANPGKVNARTARRYASKLQATPKWLDDEQKWLIQETYEFAKYRTAVLGVPCEVDHIVPLRGKLAQGLHVPWNLQVVFSKENRLKSNIFTVT
jgi:hypothetical protein